MQALRQAGMRDRHWEQLSEQLSMPLKPDKDFVLSKALALHLMDHLDTIQKVMPHCFALTLYMRPYAVFIAIQLIK